MPIKKPWVKTSEMAQLYQEQEWSIEAIGKQFGMTRAAVWTRFIKEGIPIRKTRYQLIDRERLKMLFHQEKLSMVEIAAAFSTIPLVIKKALLFHGIAERQPIKRGGYKVDFLRNLAVGETGIFVWKNNERYPHLHHTAKEIGMKISIRSLGANQYEVRRIK